MDDQSTHDGGAQDESAGVRAAGAAASERPKRSWRRVGVMVLAIVVLLPVLLFAAWTAITLNWSYSKGERAGYIQKFSQKGWVCKTWEGDIAMSTIPGSMPEHFLFSVRDDSVAHEITRLMGSRVSLTYEEHRGLPSHCFGDTPYRVTGVKAVAGP